MKKIISLTGIILLLNYLYAHAPHPYRGYPEVGKACPYFLLKNIQHFDKTRADIKDLSDKYLIFDFFTSHCAACFSSMPELSRMQKIFSSQLQIISIGKDDRTIKKVYANFRLQKDLIVPVVFDSSLFKRFVPEGVPTLVWINKKGIVKAITTEFDSAKIASFIDGRDFAFYDYSAKAISAREGYNGDLPFLTNNNGGSDTGYVYRSLISKWDPSIPVKLRYLDDYVTKVLHGRFDYLGAPLVHLYMTAYIGGDIIISPGDSRNGIMYPRLVLETKDSMNFLHFNAATGENVYCYSLTVPRETATVEKMQLIMQRDLENFFGYEVKIETRKMPCWKLMADSGAPRLLQTKGGNPDEKVSAVGLSLQNEPADELLGLIWADGATIIPLVDSTGFSFNIDLKADVVLHDMNAVRNMLHQYGLDLILSEKEMQVIVIRDKKE
ncbi:MAG TPA: TlpA disulfide reductase family protein [Puia sp.]|jgi:thiol-disulfide isomerase/thioredoxin|nr:TlpA disulfide reductase family protein [Puia sp.]